MRKKNLSVLKFRKNKISNLNNLKAIMGGIVTGETDTLTTESETNPNNSLECYTLYCGETETCETKCGGCNTNDTTRGQASQSLQVACNNFGSIVSC